MDAAYEVDGEDDDLLDLGIQLGKMRITERIGGFFRPKISEEVCPIFPFQILPLQSACYSSTENSHLAELNAILVSQARLTVFRRGDSFLKWQFSVTGPMGPKSITLHCFNQASGIHMASISGYISSVFSVDDIRNDITSAISHHPH